MIGFDEIINAAKKICWYPSAGYDLFTPFFINTVFEEDQQIDLFIFSDYVYRWMESSDWYNSEWDIAKTFEYPRDEGSFAKFFPNKLGIQKIYCLNFNKIGFKNFGAEIHKEGIIDTCESPIYHAKFLVKSEFIELREINVLLIGSHNESFCNNFLIQQKLNIHTMIYKNAQGMGGYMSGLWMFNMLNRFNAKYIVSEVRRETWNQGDENVVNFYPELGPEVSTPTYSRENQSLCVYINNIKKLFKTVTWRQLFPDENEKYHEETNSKYIGINEVGEII